MALVGDSPCSCVSEPDAYAGHGCAKNTATTRWIHFYVVIGQYECESSVNVSADDL